MAYLHPGYTSRDCCNQHGRDGLEGDLSFWHKHLIRFNKFQNISSIKLPAILWLVTIVNAHIKWHREGRVVVGHQCWNLCFTWLTWALEGLLSESLLSSLSREQHIQGGHQHTWGTSNLACQCAMVFFTTTSLYVCYLLIRLGKVAHYISIHVWPSNPLPGIPSSCNYGIHMSPSPLPVCSLGHVWWWWISSVLMMTFLIYSNKVRWIVALPASAFGPYVGDYSP